MIGERLQELRKDHNMSQAEFAKFLGVSHYTVSSYECNRSDPDDKTKIVIAKLFDVSVDYLLGLIDEPLSFNRTIHTLTLPPEFDEGECTQVKNFINFLSYEKSKKMD